MGKGYDKLYERFDGVIKENQIRFSNSQSEQAAWEYVNRSWRILTHTRKKRNFRQSLKHLMKN